ncbi:AsmA family protein [Hyphomonas sp.]|uniref:AsmA family protein n=1 Tax=Hyphomonas sp. TaxID=87 RepID=UPI000DFD345B|nr:AsmA family protein [Hyphomonas sp.]RCL89795.1 MAG: AsmA family protein [Hyphomonas sp.]
MKRVLLIVSGIAALLIIAAFSVPFFIPKSVYKNQIENAATNALQRDVTLAGDVKISVFPRISASVEQVSVANPDGFATPNMIEAGALRGSVKWMPLLSRRVDVQEIAFVDADVFLQRKADGNTNWEFASSKEASPPPEGTNGSFDAGIESAILKNASLIFQDDQSGETYKLSELDLEASLRGMDQPLSATASGRFQEQAFTVDIWLDAPEALTRNLPAQARLDLASDLANIKYDGSVQLGDAPSLNGTFETVVADLAALTQQFELDVPARSALGRLQVAGKASGALDSPSLTELKLTHDSDLLSASYEGSVSLNGDGTVAGTLSIASDRMRDLLSAAAIELAPGDTLQTFAVSGTANGTFKSVMVNNLNLSLDALRGTGQAGIDVSATTPRIIGDLSVPALDLTPFMGEPDPEKTNQGIQPWSDETLELSGLKSVNANLSLEVGSLTIGDVELTDAVMDVDLTDGLLTADLSQFKAFSGLWLGKLTVDARPATPKVGFDMQGQNVAVANLLGTLAGFDSLTGTGQFKVSAQSSGTSIDAIMQAIDGEVSTSLSDGVVKGLNVAALVRSASSLKQAIATGSIQELNFGEALSQNAETDFSSFNTVLKVNDGVANVDVMKLLSPILGVDGTGQINLAGQSMDLRLATSVDKSAQGQGSVVQLNGIPVPIRISGAWTNPKVTPDLSGVSSAFKAELGSRVLEELGVSNSAGSGSTEDVIGGLLGIKKPDPEAPTDDAPAETSAEDVAIKALGGLLNNRKKKEADTSNEN